MFRPMQDGLRRRNVLIQHASAVIAVRAVGQRLGDDGPALRAGLTCPARIDGVHPNTRVRSFVLEEGATLAPRGVNDLGEHRPGQMVSAQVLQGDAGQLRGLAPAKPGPKTPAANPLKTNLERLERDNARLRDHRCPCLSTCSSCRNGRALSGSGCWWSSWPGKCWVSPASIVARWRSGVLPLKVICRRKRASSATHRFRSALLK